MGKGANTHGHTHTLIQSYIEEEQTDERTRMAQCANQMGHSDFSDLLSKARTHTQFHRSHTLALLLSLYFASLTFLWFELNSVCDPRSAL